MITDGEQLRADDLREWNSDKVVGAFNNHVDKVGRLMRNGLTFGDNMNAEILPPSIIVPPPPVWKPYTFAAGWSAYTTIAGYSVPAYRMDFTNRVWSKGTAHHAAGVGLPIATLPLGYRPDEKHNFAQAAATVYGQILVEETGLITCVTAGGGTADVGMAFSFQAPINSAPPEAWAGNGFPVSIPTSLPEVAALLVFTAQSLTLPGEVVGIVQPDWSFSSGFIRVRALHGLTPGRRYSVTLAAIGG